MKKIIISLFILLSAQSNASALWSVDEIYYLGEILHSSRLDYEGGMKVSFEKPYVSNQKSSQACEIVSYQELVNDFELVVENHLSAYYDDEFDFNEALNLLEENLSLYSDIKKCHSVDGISSYFSLSDEFLASYKLL